MCGTQLSASATALMRGQNLPPSEHRKCRELLVECHLCHRRPSMIVRSGSLGRSVLRHITREDEVAIFGRQVAGVAGFVQCLVASFAVREVGESPAARRGVLFRVLDHELDIHG
jgi:hypothetical protein